MGSSSTLGLLFEISADPSKAETALARFGTSFNRITNLYGASTQQLNQSFKALSGQAAELQVRLAGATDPVVVNRLNESLGRTQRDLILVNQQLQKVAPTMQASVIATGAFRAHLETLHGRALIENAAFNQGLGRTGNELRQSTASAMILERMFGISLPRGINTMLARSALIGPLLQYAFSISILALFIANMDKVIAKIREAGDWLGDYTKIYKDAMAEAAKFTKESVENFRAVAEQTAKALYGDIKDRELREKQERAYVIRAGEDAVKVADQRIRAMTADQSARAAQILAIDKQVEALKREGSANAASAALLDTLEAKAHKLAEANTAQASELLKLTTQRNKDFAALQDLTTESEKAEERKAKAAEAAAKRIVQAQQKSVNEIIALHHKVETEEARQDHLRQQIAERNKKLTDEEIKWHFKIADSIKAENVEVKHLYGTWAEVLARRLGIHGSTVELIRDMNQAGISTKQLREEVIRTFVLGLPSSLNVSRKALAQWANDVKIQVTTTRAVFVMLKDTVREMEAGMAQALGQSIAAAIVYQKSIGAAMAAAVKAELAGIAGRALVKALWETAEGIACLATWNFAAAALHFKAAAIYGVVGGVAAGMGRAIPGGEYGGGGGGYAAGPAYGPARTAAPPALAPGAAGGGRFSEGGVTVIFQGPVYGGKAGIHELVTDISQAVERQGARLISTESKGLRGGGG